ncbi:efflux RND transporter permease subunit [Parvularcula sp. ZS-1/3]|uniref:Efflux RND transporter permease subunit n=1 Tax=Parvularcula mediterranea TaxID=2732508 RepID=A0A7Y3RLH4_9PROT|nr:efflux RND transporter permease subunit [Parvularcula mediterranea]NNU16289.1 efflux RND transporter permease subunit [Parvularcula mediterranea]
MNKLIRWFIDSRVAANLLAIFLVAAGLVSARSLTVRLFPDVDPYTVNITVPYPGASPEEVEEGIVEPIEEQVQGLDGVRKINGLAAENVANIVVQLDFGADTAEIANDVRNAVNQITVFPEAAEEPQISELESNETIAQLTVSGSRDPAELKKLADDLRSQIISSPAISRVEIAGIQEYLIDITIPSARLEALGLSLDQIASTIRARSLELSGGEIEDERSRFLVRTLGEAEIGEEFEKITILTSEEQAPVLLGEIADVRDGLSENPYFMRLNGQPAVALNIIRVGDEKVFEMMDAVTKAVDEAQSYMPPGVEAQILWEQASNLRDRVDLLVKNGLIGFILIFVILLLFLDVRVAFWVGVGVAISFMGVFIPMAAAGIAINQLSLFGFILAIGIVVDDAIVVGENIYATVEDGEEDPKQAAKRGTIRVAPPVFFSVSTTVAAFLPLMFVPSTVGQFIGDIAFVVSAVLVLSLIESFYILPKHLSHLHDRPPGKLSIRRYADPLRNWVARKLDHFSANRLKPAIQFAVYKPLATAFFSLGALIATFGLFSGGVITTIFFPEIEGNFVTGELKLAEAASETQTIGSVEQILDAAQVAAQEISERTGTPVEDIIENVFWSLGQKTSNTDVGNVTTSGGAAANYAFIEVRLQDAAVRKFTAPEFERRWRDATGRIPGAQTLTFSYDLVAGGLPVQVQVASDDDAKAREVVGKLRKKLEAIPGVFDATDDRSRTTGEVQISLLPEAASYGVDLQTVARSVRAAFFGAEAVRIQRDREEIEVRVRLPEDERRTIEDVKKQRIILGDVSVPISAVADISIGQAPASITRINGERVFVISSDVDDAVTTGGAVTQAILGPAWAEIAADYPGVSVSPAGEQEEQARALPALLRNFVLAMFCIYALLALAFRSYTQPFIVLSVIPFGLIGAFWGHALLGLQISLLSIFGIIGLSGVIINDALLMVDFINEKLEKGIEVGKAITDAAIERFRPIILTSLTTFLGVTPIVLEQSVQAAFLKPTAVSLGFGILFGTVVLMFVVPAMAMLHFRAKRRTKQAGEFIRRKVKSMGDKDLAKAG